MGEKLEDLVDQSNELNMASKAYMREAKSMNGCC